MRMLLIRLLVCTAVGLAMALTTYLCAYYDLRENDNYHRQQDLAFRGLADLKKAVDAYHQKNGKYPKRLAELSREFPSLNILIDVDGSTPDPWMRPYQYHLEGDGYEILSWGRDGKSGGEGFDHDLIVTNRSPDGDHMNWRQVMSIPTLRQFASDYPTQWVNYLCGLTGICAFLSCMNSQRLARKSMTGALVGLGITLVACLFVTSTMCALHAMPPSGH